jgi:hypothetical protein
MGIFTIPTQIVSTGVFVRSLVQWFKGRYPKTRIPGYVIILITFLFNFVATLAVDVYLVSTSGTFPSFILIKSIACTIISILYHDFNTGFKPLQIINVPAQNAATKTAVAQPVSNPVAPTDQPVL